MSLQPESQIVLLRINTGDVGWWNQPGSCRAFPTRTSAERTRRFIASSSGKDEVKRCLTGLLRSARVLDIVFSVPMPVHTCSYLYKQIKVTWCTILLLVISLMSLCVLLNEIQELYSYRHKTPSRDRQGAGANSNHCRIAPAP